MTTHEPSEIKLFTEHDTRRRLQLHFNSLPVCCALALVFAAGCTPSAQVPGQRQVQTQTLDVAGQPPSDLAAPSSGAEENPADSQRLDQLRLSRAHDAFSPDFSIGPGDILRVSVPGVDELKDYEVRVSADNTITLPVTGNMYFIGDWQLDCVVSGYAYLVIFEFVTPRYRHAQNVSRADRKIRRERVMRTAEPKLFESLRVSGIFFSAGRWRRKIRRRLACHVESLRLNLALAGNLCRRRAAGGEHQSERAANRQAVEMQLQPPASVLSRKYLYFRRLMSCHSTRVSPGEFRVLGCHRPGFFARHVESL